jgi:hypothetical protein
MGSHSLGARDATARAHAVPPPRVESVAGLTFQPLDDDWFPLPDLTGGIRDIPGACGTAPSDEVIMLGDHRWSADDADPWASPIGYSLARSVAQPHPVAAPPPVQELTG